MFQFYLFSAHYIVLQTKNNLRSVSIAQVISVIMKDNSLTVVSTIKS